MSNTKTVMSQAANTLTTPLNVEDVFSTYLYTGNSSTQTITNGIDLDGEGGLVWTKSRAQVRSHSIHDTERGVLKRLRTDTTSAEGTVGGSGSILQFNSDGYNLGGNSLENEGDQPFTSWTFRKAPKFFDVVTYTGDGTIGRTVSHNLGVAPGMMIVKRTDSTGNWCVYHRGIDYDGDSAPETDYIYLNTTGGAGDSIALWNDTAPTATEFTLYNNAQVNASGGTYVAYLFAHNDGDGEFGPDGDQDIIKCGSFTTDGSGNATVDLGWEPQFVIIKRTSSAESWLMHDIMRGWSNGSDDARLFPDLSNAESFSGRGHPTSTGFYSTATASQTYIYIAIRRGTKVPESGTEVFASDFARAAADGEKPEYRSGFPVDTRLTLYRDGGSSSYPAMGSRITGNEYLVTSSTAAGGAWTAQTFDYMNGFMNTAATTINTTLISHMWKRAPKFFDVVAYTGTSSTSTFKHNLGVKPEMIWVKGRNVGTYGWYVYHEAVTANDQLYLHLTNAAGGGFMANTEPTAEVFTLGNTTGANNSSYNYIAYLFASLAGISKVGSYTGDGTGNRVIDCGFTTGARFLIIKRTDGTGNWSVWDTERGILAGDVDARLELNTADAEENTTNHIDPDPSGFKIISNFNTSGQEYIFYAVA